MRVLQLNLWGRSEPYRIRADMLHREIEALAPDVITLQEVIGVDAECNQAAELFGPLSYHVRFDPRPGRSDFEWGMAIATRHRPGELEVKELAHGGVAIASRISIGADQLWFCSACPLGWWPSQEVQREQECVALDEWLTDLAREDELPPVMGGDFDATPDAASIRFLTGLQSLGGVSTHWVDALRWPATGRRATHGRLTTRTSPPRRHSRNPATAAGSTTSSSDRHSSGGRGSSCARRPSC